MSTLNESNVNERSATRWSRRLVWANVVALLAVAVFFRAWRLDHVPGVNGDEAWMGVQAQRWIDGQLGTLTTPTGNLINVFHFGPQVLLHTFWSPSIGLLRLPVLISGLLALCVNYWLCRYVFGRGPAAWSTVILAVLPVNIAYSRFAWDASQTVLFTLPVIYLSVLVVQRRDRWFRWLALAALIHLCAIVVHPTNVFLAPFPVIALMIVSWPVLAKSLLAARRSWSWRLAWLSVLLLLLGAVATIWPWVQLAGQRVASPPHYLLFLENALDFFAGTTIYRYISGAPGGTNPVWILLFRMFAAGLMLVAGCGLWRFGSGLNEKRLVVSATIASLGAFFLFAGPLAIAAGNERYAMSLIAPVSLSLALGLHWWLSQRPVATRLVGITAGWLVLIGFYANYFQFVGRTGGGAHVAFRTGAIDPKQAVAYYLEHTAESREAVIAVATEWWSYWPLAYLTHEFPRVAVVGTIDGDAEFGQAAALPAVVPYLGDGSPLLHRDGVEICFVEFSETGRAAEIEQRFAGDGIDTRAAHIHDSSQRPVITVVWPK